MLILTQGVLIALEGIDGSGKTTLTQLLATRLRTIIAVVATTKEPGGTPLGKQLRSLLQEQRISVSPRAEYLLFAADRAQHFHELVLPALAQHAVVISDRLADSSLVYQGCGRGLDTDLISRVNSWAMQGRRPDITVYIRLSAAQAYQRIMQRNEQLTAFEKEKQDFFQRLVEGFDILYKERADVITLDGTLLPESLADMAYTRIAYQIQANYSR